MPNELACSSKVASGSETRVVGAKQVRRALDAGRAKAVWLAADADPGLTGPISALCAERGVPVETVSSMKELGRSCGIAVGAAVAAAVDN